MLESCSLNMYITLSRMQNREAVSLAKTLSTGSPTGKLDIARCKHTYNHQWYNNRPAQKHNKVRLPDIVIENGYYNVCMLDEAVFQNLGAEFYLFASNGRFQLSAKKRLILNRKAGQYARDNSKQTYTEGNHTFLVSIEISVWTFPREALQTISKMVTLLLCFGLSLSRTKSVDDWSISAVQKADIRQYRTADSLSIKCIKKKLRLTMRDPTYKKWLTQVALGALGNVMGSHLAVWAKKRGQIGRWSIYRRGSLKWRK